MGSNSRKNWKDALFGLIFIVSGLVGAYIVAGSMIIGYIASTNWVEVPAKIHNIRLISNYDSDSTTYTIEGSYSYDFDGINYQNDRISLNFGADSSRNYWQKLERSLLADQKVNEAIAIVNPNDPAEATLDRTLRWTSMLFGLIFFFGFGGVGCFLMWSSLSQPSKKNGEFGLLKNDENGIHSNKKSGMAILGLIFAGIPMIFLPFALRDGAYGGAFLLLILLLIGVNTLHHAFKLYRAYKRFGPTPLLLDPAQPGVGGQLGARFSIDALGIGSNPDSDTQFRATLTCSEKRKSRENIKKRVVWKEEAPVYLEQTTSGVDTSFLFEIPDSCSPSGEFSQRSWIEWSLSVQGEFSTGDMPGFERDWQVVVGNKAAQASDSLIIPESFVQNYEQSSEDRAKTSDLEKMLVTEDGQSINVQRFESALQPFFKIMRILRTLFIGFVVIVVIVVLIILLSIII